MRSERHELDAVRWISNHANRPPSVIAQPSDRTPKRAERSLCSGAYGHVNSTWSASPTVLSDLIRIPLDRLARCWHGEFR